VKPEFVPLVRLPLPEEPLVNQELARVVLESTELPGSDCVLPMSELALSYQLVQWDELSQEES
jgi:hypothetical protein